MAVDDLKKAVNSIINERLNSPIIGAFILSWMVFNWKVIIFLIFETQKKFEGDKIEYIQNHYLTDPWTYLWWPLIFAILYPIISLITYSFTELVNLTKNEVNFFIQKKKSIDTNQKMDLLKEVSDQKSNYENLLTEKEDAMKALSDTLTKQIDEYDSLTEVLKEEKKELEKMNGTLRDESTSIKKENESLKNDLQKKDSEILANEAKLKRRIDKLEHSESGLKRKLIGAKNQISKENIRKPLDFEEYEDAIMSEGDAITMFDKLGKNSKNKYMEITIPSEEIYDFFTENGLWESSPLNVSKLRLTEEGIELYSTLRKKIEKKIKENEEDSKSEKPQRPIKKL